MTPDLQELLDLTWRALEDATTRRTPFTLGLLGTVDASGAPKVRAVILRRLDVGRGRIMIATHAESEKAAEIRGYPLVALTVNDDVAEVQLRMEGRAEIVEEADERRSGWRSLGPRARHLYRSPLTPGKPLIVTQVASETVSATSRHRDEPAEFDRFAWVAIRLDRLDQLDMAPKDHERCKFVREGRVWTGERVVP